MKRNIAVVMLTLTSVGVWCYIAVAQDGSFSDPLTLDPEPKSAPAEQSERSKLSRNEIAHAAKSQQLVREYSRTNDPTKRRELESELNTVVAAHFSIKQRLRALELTELAAKLDQLRSRHRRRDDAQAQIVRNRVQQLLREADGIGWGSGTAGPPGFGPVIVPEFNGGAQPFPAQFDPEVEVEAESAFAPLEPRR